VTDTELPTARLRDEQAQLEATFVPGAGMLCCSLRHHGEELLAQNAGVAAYAERGKTMGIPLLYPWANRLAAFDYTVAGRTVRVPHDDPALIALDQNGLPIHGVIGGRLVWQLTDGLGAPAPGRGADVEAAPGAGVDTEVAPDADWAPGTAAASGPGPRSLAARLSWSEAVPELFEVFPFRHDLLYEARLGDGRLEIEVTVHACGADAVPLAFGFHPYLAPGGPREQWLIELPAMRHLALDREQIPLGIEDPASAPQRFELGGREFDDGFDAEATPAPVRFAVTAPARRLELELLRGYPYAQVYAPLGGHFICFEPMTAPANALRSGEGLRLLAPGERHSAAFSIQIKNPAV
jgi:aldose 1-epimerase